MAVPRDPYERVQYYQDPSRNWAPDGTIDMNIWNQQSTSGFSANTPPNLMNDPALYGAVADTNNAIIGGNYAVDASNTGIPGQGSEYVQSSGANANPIVAQANAGGSSSISNVQTSMPVPFQNANRDVGAGNTSNSSFGGGGYQKGYMGVTPGRGLSVSGYATPMAESAVPQGIMSQRTALETANNSSFAELDQMQGGIDKLSGMNQGYLNAEQNVDHLQMMESRNDPFGVDQMQGRIDELSGMNERYLNAQENVANLQGNVQPGIGAITDDQLGKMGDRLGRGLMHGSDELSSSPLRSNYKESFGLMGAGLDMPADDAMHQSFRLDATGENPATKPSWAPFTPNTQDQFALNTGFGDLGAQAAIDAPTQLSMMNKMKLAGGKMNQAMDKFGGAGNVAGGVMMAGGNLMAMGQYKDAIGDVDKGLGEIPSMIGETLSDAQNQIGDAKQIMKTGVESSRDTAGSKLELTLDKIANEPKDSVSNVKGSSNRIRRTLQDGIDSTVDMASNKLDQSISDISEDKRDSLAYIESMREELKSKKKELEKEKKQAGIGAAVGVGSILADAVVPGSGAVLRTGWNQYSSRT